MTITESVVINRCRLVPVIVSTGMIVVPHGIWMVRSWERLTVLTGGALYLDRRTGRSMVNTGHWF